jgi:hypothetical protein
VPALAFAGPVPHFEDYETICRSLQGEEGMRRRK